MLDRLLSKKDRMREGTPLMHFLRPLAEKRQQAQVDRTMQVLQQYNALTQLLQGGMPGGMPQIGMPQMGAPQAGMPQMGMPQMGVGMPQAGRRLPQLGGLQGGMRRGV